MGVNWPCLPFPVWLGFFTSPLSLTPTCRPGNITDSSTTCPSALCTCTSRGGSVRTSYSAQYVVLCRVLSTRTSTHLLPAHSAHSMDLLFPGWTHSSNQCIEDLNYSHQTTIHVFIGILLLSLASLGGGPVPQYCICALYKGYYSELN